MFRRQLEVHDTLSGEDWVDYSVTARSDSTAEGHTARVSRGTSAHARRYNPLVSSSTDPTAADSSRRWVALAAICVLVLLMTPSPAGRELESTLRQAQSAMQVGDANLALEHLEHALTLAPGLTWLHTEAGRAAMASGDPSRALGHFRAAGGPNGLEGPDACLQLQAVVALGTASPGIAAPLGCILPATPGPPQETSAGDGEDILASLERALRQRPQDEDIERRYGLALAALRPERAPAFLVELRRKQPQHAELLDGLLAVLQETPERNGSGEPAFSVGQVLAAHGLWQEALMAFDEAVRASVEDPDARAYRALALHRLGEDALAEIRTVRQSAPTSVTAAVFEATVLRDRGFPDQARAILERTRELVPDDPMVSAELAAAYLEMGDLIGAAEFYSEAAAAQPDRPEYWRLLAQFSIDHEFDIGSIGMPAARNAVALDRANPDSLTLLARAHLDAGSPLLAERLLLDALRIDPRHPAALFTWGTYLWGQGNVEAARATFSSLVGIDPQGPYADLARRMLNAEGP
jgi:tetratricopeptide (TPR) repeat protein